MLVVYSILGAIAIALLGGLVGFCGGGLIAVVAGLPERQRRGSFALGASVMLAVLTFFSALMALASCFLMKIQ